MRRRLLGVLLRAGLVAGTGAAIMGLFALTKAAMGNEQWSGAAVRYSLTYPVRAVIRVTNTGFNDDAGTGCDVVPYARDGAWLGDGYTVIARPIPPGRSRTVTAVIRVPRADLRQIAGIAVWCS